MHLRPFAKDTVYRFLNSARINRLRFTTGLSAKIIEDAISPLTSEQRENVLIIDDSVFERNRSKKVELLTKVFDHAKRNYIYGFRMLTLDWSDGNTFMPVNSALLSSENDNTVILLHQLTLEELLRRAGSERQGGKAQECCRISRLSNAVFRCQDKQETSRVSWGSNKYS